jgi:hypothetical protein
MHRFAFGCALFALTLAACGSNSCPSGDCTPYPTFQDCYNDHHLMESFPSDQAIEICCIDHPIATAKRNTVCGATTQSCLTYVTATCANPVMCGNLMDTTDPNLQTDINTACTNYPHDSGRQ